MIIAWSKMNYHERDSQRRNRRDTIISRLKAEGIKYTLSNGYGGDKFILEADTCPKSISRLVNVVDKELYS